MLPKRSAYVKIYDGQNKLMYFLIEHNDLLGKYNTISDKFSANIKKEFDNKTAYNKLFLKTKIKSHDDEVTDFYNKKIFKVTSKHICLECKDIEKKVTRHINDNLSDFFFFSESDYG